MPNDKLRRQIAHEAARLLYSREESEYLRAKLKAAKRLFGGDVRPRDLPANAEIRDQVASFARLYEGDKRLDNLRDMRVAALRVMRLLANFRPRLIGSVLTGHIRQGSDIDLHVFADSLEPITAALDSEGMSYTIERKRVKKEGVERTFTHVHIEDSYPFELTIYGSKQAHIVTKSSITGRAIERATAAELQMLLKEQYPDLCLEQAVLDAEAKVDRFQIYEMLLIPLEQVKGDPRYHPEGDALYHSLQVYDLARDDYAYDEEFLLAALLHDIGKAIDPANHTAAALEALEGVITPRTAWLIERHMDAHAIRAGTIGHRRHQLLRENENYEDLLHLEQCDRRGRQKGVEVPELREAIEQLRELSRMCGE